MPAPSWSGYTELQDGVISRGQLLGLGLSPAQARRNVDNGRWRPLFPGVYATFTGPVGPVSRVWAAVLYAGAGAAASHRTALWLAGFLDVAVDPVHISVPANRRVLPQPGVRLHLSRALLASPDTVLHPGALPPRHRLESALLDYCEAESDGQTTHLVLSAIQQRLTTAGRIRASLGARSRHRWRRLIVDVLGEAEAGVQSPLELRYRRKVELAHSLPAGTRNRLEMSPSGSRYRDVRYIPWPLIVELDGREAHPGHQAFRDLRRDNLAVLGGDATLRYGWRDVVGSPCAVAQQVAHVLTAQGWRGQLTPCGTGCTAAPPPPGRS